MESSTIDNLCNKYSSYYQNKDEDSKGYRFRKLCKNDLNSDYFSLLQELTTSPYPENKEDIYAHFDTMINSGLLILVVIEEIESRKIIGSGSLILEPKLIHGLSYVGHIEDIVISTTCRGKGLGKNLINLLCDISESKGCYKVILDCSEDNAKFYEKCGMKRKSLQYEKRFG